MSYNYGAWCESPRRRWRALILVGLAVTALTFALGASLAASAFSYTGTRDAGTAAHARRHGHGESCRPRHARGRRHRHCGRPPSHSSGHVPLPNSTSRPHRASLPVIGANRTGSVTGGPVGSILTPVDGGGGQACSGSADQRVLYWYHYELFYNYWNACSGYAGRSWQDSGYFYSGAPSWAYWDSGPYFG